MPWMAAAAGIGALGSIIGGAISGKPKTSTQTPTLSPELQAIQHQLLDYSTGLINNPGQGLAPLKSAAMGGVNRNFDDISKRMTSNFSNRGFGRSGKLLTNQTGLEISRAGAMSGVDTQFDQMALDQQQRGASLSASLLSSGRGTETTSPDTSTGDAFMSGGNALQNLAQLLMFQKAFKH